MLDNHKWISSIHDKYNDSEELEKKLKEIHEEAKDKGMVVILTDLGNMSFYGKKIGYFEIEIYKKVWVFNAQFANII